MQTPLLSSRPGQLLLVVTLLCACAAVAGCSSGNTGGGERPPEVDLDEGRKLFQQRCKSCHTLADADARGTLGPPLDDLPLDYERVREQIERGGGGMPAEIYEGEDAETVAAYVAEVSR